MRDDRLAETLPPAGDPAGRRWSLEELLHRAEWVEELALRLARAPDARAGEVGRARRDPGVGATEDVLLRAELQRALVARVLALAEPTRSVLLQCFHRRDETSAVAAALGLSPERVRAHLAQGLAELRAALDREHGDRRRWVAAYAPLASRARRRLGVEPPAPAFTSRGAGRLATLGLPLAAALLLLVTWRLPPQLGGEPTALVRVARDAARAPLALRALDAEGAEVDVDALRPDELRGAGVTAADSGLWLRVPTRAVRLELVEGLEVRGSVPLALRPDARVEVRL